MSRANEGLSWVRWFASDWRGSVRTARMGPEERILYAELLFLQADEGPFRMDAVALQFPLRLPSALIKRCWPAIADCFERGGDDLWSNSKMATEIARGLEAKKSLSERGKRGASVRWGATANTSANSPADATGYAPPTPTPSPNSDPATTDSDARARAVAAGVSPGTGPEGSGLDANEPEPVHEGWARLCRFFGKSRHDPALVGEARSWVRGRAATAERDVVGLIAWAESREEPHAALLHAIHHGFALEKAKGGSSR